MTQKVVTRVVELTAWRFNGEDETDLPDWVHARMQSVGRMALEIGTTQGVHIAQRGDWLVRDANGEVDVCPAETFSRRYQSLSGDISLVQLAVTSPALMASNWNSAIVERASEAFHDAFASGQPGALPWANTSESWKAATRLAIRKALTAAIAVPNPAKSN